jgi:hypothetical protein
MSLIDITDLSPEDLARLADSPLAEALAKDDSEHNRMQHVVGIVMP